MNRKLAVTCVAFVSAILLAGTAMAKPKPVVPPSTPVVVIPPGTVVVINDQGPISD